MSKPLKLGLIGAGNFGSFCLQAYCELPEVRLVAVADIDLPRARRIAPQDIPVYADYRELLADQNVKAVAITTPPDLHARMVKEAAEKGKHVFVEKPLATSMTEAKKAVAAAQAAGVRLGINYVLRHHRLHQLAATVVKKLALGLFQFWSLENFATDDTLLPDHWFWNPERSGGIHIEHGVHFFDLCNQLAGRQPDYICGGRQQRPDGRIDRVSATIRYGDDVLATFYHSFNQIGRFEQTTIRLGCTRGHMVIEGWIPTRLTLNALVDESGLDLLKDLFGAGLQIKERFAGATTNMSHGGSIDHIVAEVQAVANEPERQLAYKRAIPWQELFETTAPRQSLLMMRWIVWP
jgi:predicted dehydrogenase